MDTRRIAVDMVTDRIAGRLLKGQSSLPLGALPPSSGNVLELPYEDIGLNFVLYDFGGRPSATALKGDRILWKYRFHNEDRRAEYIDSVVKKAKEHIEEVKKKREERKQTKHSYTVGDILISNWGYDQTNIDFYQVVRAEDKSIYIQRIGKKKVGQDHVVAEPSDKAGPVMRKIPSQSGAIKISTYQRAYKWDGRPAFETPPQFGH